MDPSGKSKGPPPAVKKVLSMFGSGKEEDRMVGYLSFLKIGPKLLKFLPGNFYVPSEFHSRYLFLAATFHHVKMSSKFFHSSRSHRSQISVLKSNDVTLNLFLGVYMTEHMHTASVLKLMRFWLSWLCFRDCGELQKHPCKFCISKELLIKDASECE